MTICNPKGIEQALNNENADEFEFPENRKKLRFNTMKIDSFD